MGSRSRPGGNKDVKTRVLQIWFPMSFQKQYLFTLEWQMTLMMIIKTAGSRKDTEGIKEDLNQGHLIRFLC